MLTKNLSMITGLGILKLNLWKWEYFKKKKKQGKKEEKNKPNY